MEANNLLDEIVERKLFRANGVAGIWPANSLVMILKFTVMTTVQK
jgi:cobalamin-dependent methionine synthase I